jgi:hemerythrin
MTDYKWTSDLSVGDSSIDDDHQELFSLIAEMKAADFNDGFLQGLIGRLEAYTEYHFAREEEYMKAHNFPDLEDHLHQHKMFVEWLKTVQKTYQRAQESPYQIADLVNEYLGNWLTTHILVEDMKYRDFILNAQQKG